MDRPGKEREHPPSVVRGSGGLPSIASGSPSQYSDPTHILGCSREQALELFDGRPVTPGEAEALAETSYPWRRHLHDPGSYWITTSETARLLQLSAPQVKRLLDRGRLRHVRHVSGVRLMRRAQIVALAEARHAPHTAPGPHVHDRPTTSFMRP
jgi:excisionase family DNA binding protein